MKIEVIIVAAGNGVRFGSKLPKALVLLNRKPLLAYSLNIFEQNKAISGIIVVANGEHLPRFLALCRGHKKVKAVVPGGKMRVDSVKCGLAVLDTDTDIVLVHDAARPLIDDALLGRLTQALRAHKAVIAAVPVKATIKQVNAKTLWVEKTLPRNLLWDVQTPQGFHKDVLIKAHSRKFKGEATDDAVLVEQMGVKVKVVMGDYKNIKVTTPEDFEIAKELAFDNMIGRGLADSKAGRTISSVQLRKRIKVWK